MFEYVKVEFECVWVLENVFLIYAQIYFVLMIKNQISKQNLNLILLK